MRVRFWGTRGSLPVALSANDIRGRIVAALQVASAAPPLDEGAIETFVHGLPFALRGTYGGNTSCVEIITGDADALILDAGSGLRAFSQDLLSSGRAVGRTFHLLLSHLHWDHVMGFPFFMPAYFPGNRIRIYGCHDCIETALRAQQAAPGFPVDFDQLGATIEFVRLRPGETTEIAGCRVTPKAQLHGGDSYGYRIARGDEVVVYSTDSEHKLENAESTEAFVEFFRAADLVIFDAMYSLADAVSVKSDWGHSSNVIGVELCQMAGARHLCLFHHEPVFDDARLDMILAESRRLEALTRGDGPPLAVSTAYDGLIVDL